MAVTRYLQKFTNFSEDSEYVFPRNHYEMQIQQPLRQPRAAVIGTDYAIPLRGEAVALKGLSVVRIRFMLVDFVADDLDFKRDDMLTKLYDFARGWLVYTTGEKARASLSSMPEISITYERPHILPITLAFDIWSDFSL